MRIFVMMMITILACLSEAYADTYRCDEVDNLAKLGYDGTAKVTVVGKDKECKFSIGGASADGKVPNSDFQQERNDSEFLSQSSDQFIKTRLAQIVSQTAVQFGDTASFVAENINADSDLSSIDCEKGEKTEIGKLIVYCEVIDVATNTDAQGFESGFISAIVFRSKYVFVFADASGNESMMVTFINFGP